MHNSGFRQLRMFPMTARMLPRASNLPSLVAALLGLAACDPLGNLKAPTCAASGGGSSCPTGQICDVGTGRCTAGCGGVSVCQANQN